MNALLGLLLAAQAAPPDAPLTPIPVDWSTLPELALLRPVPAIPELSGYVHAEVLAGRCRAQGSTVQVQVAVLVGDTGMVRRVVPRAIDCPTVEQYASGIVSRMARRNVPAPAVDTWYRTSVTFTWNP